jgi:hypothetical protein
MTIEQFLIERMTLGHEYGVSSNAMIREALEGTPVEQYWEYPHDHEDLARCCNTWARAPWSLKALMLARMYSYFEYAMNGYREKEVITFRSPPSRVSRFLDFVDRTRKRHWSAV